MDAARGISPPGLSLPPPSGLGVLGAGAGRLSSTWLRSSKFWEALRLWGGRVLPSLPL